MANEPTWVLSVNEVAQRLGWTLRETRERLWKEHEARGSTLLFKRSGAPNAKLWVDATQLPEIFPLHFATENGIEHPRDRELRVALEQLDIALERAKAAVTAKDGT